MSRKLPKISPETLAKFGGCMGCAYLNGLTQCNTCHASRPNHQTRTRREIVRRVREEGMTVPEAEESMGVGPGPVIN